MRRITFYSEGRDGKSTLALSLSLALASQGRNVFLLKITSNINEELEELEIEGLKPLNEFIKGKETFRETTSSIENLCNIMDGNVLFAVLSSDYELINVYGESLMDIISNKIDDVYFINDIIVDGSPNAKELSTIMMLSSDVVLIPFRPLKESIMNAYKLSRILNHFNITHYLIMNMASYNSGEILKFISQITKCKVIGMVPAYDIEEESTLIFKLARSNIMKLLIEKISEKVR